MCYVHSLLIVVSITILVHIVFCVVPSWPRLIVYVRYGYRRTCINLYAQPCGSGPQQVAATIYKQKNLTMHNYNEWFYPSLQPICKLHVMIESLDPLANALIQCC